MGDPCGVGDVLRPDSSAVAVATARGFLLVLELMYPNGSVRAAAAAGRMRGSAAPARVPVAYQPVDAAHARLVLKYVEPPVSATTVVTVVSTAKPLVVLVVAAPVSSVVRVTVVSIAEPLGVLVVGAPVSSVVQVTVVSIAEPLGVLVVGAPVSSVAGESVVSADGAPAGWLGLPVAFGSTELLCVFFLSFVVFL
jgi:hypothetical protein